MALGALLMVSALLLAFTTYGMIAAVLGVVSLCGGLWLRASRSR